MERTWREHMALKGVAEIQSSLRTRSSLSKRLRWRFHSEIYMLRAVLMCATVSLHQPQPT